jgi:uncharacterized protein YjbI with pentapeptide repeats
MADPQQLALLRQGAHVWNRWRMENSGTEPDFREADLSGADLRWADLRRASLIGANLAKAKLGAACLHETIFEIRI